MSLINVKNILNKYRLEHPLVFYFMLLYLGGLVIYISVYLFFFADHHQPLAMNELGDFLAGAFSPIAFLFLYLGYRQNSKALEIQANQLAISNSSLQKQCEELAESVKQQTELVLTAKEELKLTVKQHEQINKQQLIQAQPYFHISEIKVKVIKVNKTIDFNISFKIKNSRAMCRSLFFQFSLNQEGPAFLPENSTYFELINNNTTNSVPSYVQSTLRGEITEYFNSEVFLHFCYTDAFDVFQIKRFRIFLLQEDSTIYVYDSHTSVSQIFY